MIFLLNYEWESKKVQRVLGNEPINLEEDKKPRDLEDPNKARLMFTDADMAMAMDPEYEKFRKIL